jgi:hypothetical protein
LNRVAKTTRIARETRNNRAKNKHRKCRGQKRESKGGRGDCREADNGAWNPGPCRWSFLQVSEMANPARATRRSRPQRMATNEAKIWRGPTRSRSGDDQRGREQRRTRPASARARRRRDWSPVARGGEEGGSPSAGLEPDGGDYGGGGWCWRPVTATKERGGTSSPGDLECVVGGQIERCS